MRALVTGLLLAILLAGCDGDPRPLEEAVESSGLQLASIAITPSRDNAGGVFMNIDEQLQFTITGTNTASETFEISSVDRRWVSSNPAVGTINRNGLFSSIANGDVNVSVRVGGVVSPAFSLRVSDATLTSISSIEGNTSLSHCSEANYSALGLFSDGTTRGLGSVVWSLPAATNAEPIARVLETRDDRVTVAADSPGQFTLQAAVGDASTVVPVTVADDLESVQIEGVSPIFMILGQTRNLKATALRADESRADVTRVVDWSVNGSVNLASVSENIGSIGLLRALRVGDGSVAISCADQRMEVALRVAEPENIESLAFDPDLPQQLLRLSIGTYQMKVEATLTEDNNSTIDVTDFADWEVTSGEDFISVDNQGSERGLVTLKAQGAAVLEASYAGESKSISLIIQ